MRFKGWFGPKLIGYGVGPRSWEGWLATVLVVAAALGSRWVPWQHYGLPGWSGAAFHAALLAGFLLLVWATYEPDA